VSRAASPRPRSCIGGKRKKGEEALLKESYVCNVTIRKKRKEEETRELNFALPIIAFLAARGEEKKAVAVLVADPERRYPRAGEDGRKVLKPLLGLLDRDRNGKFMIIYFSSPHNLKKRERGKPVSARRTSS